MPKAGKKEEVEEEVPVPQPRGVQVAAPMSGAASLPNLHSAAESLSVAPQLTKPLAATQTLNTAGPSQHRGSDSPSHRAEEEEGEEEGATAGDDDSADAEPDILSTLVKHRFTQSLSSFTFSPSTMLGSAMTSAAPSSDGPPFTSTAAASQVPSTNKPRQQVDQGLSRTESSGGITELLFARRLKARRHEAQDIQWRAPQYFQEYPNLLQSRSLLLPSVLPSLKAIQTALTNAKGSSGGAGHGRGDHIMAPVTGKIDSLFSAEMLFQESTKDSKGKSL